MPGQDVLLEDLRRVAVELKRGRVQLQDVFCPDVGRARRRAADDLLEVGRKLGALRLRAWPDDCQ